MTFITFENLQNELIKSMKDKNQLRKNVVSNIIATAKNMAIAQGLKDKINEEIVTAAIIKEKKTYQEMVNSCPPDREETLMEYKKCVSYVEEFAPRMMSEAEVLEVVAKELASISLNIKGVNKGLLMKNVMSKLKGKADGKLISTMVDKILEEYQNNHGVVGFVSGIIKTKDFNASYVCNQDHCSVIVNKDTDTQVKV